MSDGTRHPAGADFVACADRADARTQLREFLEQPVAGGGMLLVVGPRGVGKSRLVDEALNDRDYRPGWFRHLLRTLFGEPECSQRLLLRRAPKGVERLILPVPISPFAFLPDACRGQQEPPSAAAPAAPSGPPSDPAAAVLSNLVFGLTNAIDPHLSTRRFGKTLRQRLGWWNFWFSRTALASHAPWCGNALVLAAVVIVFFVCLVGASQTDFSAWAAHQAQWPNVLLSVVALLLGWLTLRWFDWRALIRFNDLLYDLIHSDRSHLTTVEDDTQSRGIKVGADPFMQIAGYVALLTGVLGLVATFAPDLLPDWLKGWLMIASERASDGSSSDGSPNLVSLILTTAGLILLVSGRAQHRSQASLEASFSSRNAAWTVNLLRRYLYLLHRCGLEPVLVVDELDKLEVTAHARHEKSLGAVVADELDKLEGRPPTPDAPAPIDEFVRALERLKDSLGTEFLWVLIGGPALWLRVQRERLRTLPGPLATVITRSIVIGPSDWESADRYLQRFVRGNCPAQIARRRIAWLRARGHFMLMPNEMHAAPSSQAQPPASAAPTGPADGEAKRAERLCEWIMALWEPTAWHQYASIGGEPPAFPPWRQVWIRVGILDLAAQLLREPDGRCLAAPALRVSDARKLLVDDDQKRLTRLGQALFFNYLVTCYGDPHRDPDSAEAPLAGIRIPGPSQAPVIHWG